ncbi:MAG: hypothetical protein FWH55_03410 [Oscillospiraceae bacterium]|nr:hypothetical protein [Oscillospiraceae bacterium]
MGRLNLTILDNDVRYMENLSSFILENYNHRFNLNSFSDTDAFIKHLEGTAPAPDIVAVSRDNYSSKLKGLDIGMILVICDGFAGDGYDGLGALERYTDADTFIGGILKHYANKADSQQSEFISKGLYDTKIILVASPSGGSGKTSVSIGLCSLFSRMTPSVLYFSLDRTRIDNIVENNPQLSGLNPSSRSGGMSDIILAIKSRREKLPLLLEALKTDFGGYNFSCYNPPIFPMDLDEMNPSEIELLIESIRNLGTFSRVVIDTHSGFSVINKVIMELSDSIFFVMNDNPSEVKKLYTLKEQMDRVYSERAQFIYKRICVLLNEVTPCKFGKFSNEQKSLISEQSFGSRIISLPYCEKISGAYSVDLLSDVRYGFASALAEVVQVCQ